MRLEKNAYGDDLPVSITIANIINYPPHYHKDVEIIYVIKGEIQFKNGPFSYLLKAGDVFTNNKCEVHSMKSNGEPNEIISIKISSQFFTRFFPKLTKSTYMFYSDKEKVPQQEHLKYMLLNLVDKYLKQSYNYKQQCIDETLKIIQYLNDNFNVFGFGINQLKKIESTNPIIINRLHNIIHYTYDNHSTNITLDELADMEHLNPYYLSHLIKDNIGISFVEFLYFVRVEWSEVNLLDPDKKISTIAKEVGFSSTAYYKKYFQKWFGCTPEEYRKQCLPMIKSAKNSEILQPMNSSDAISTIVTMLHASDAYDAAQPFARSSKLKLNIHKSDPAIMTIEHRPRILVTLDDYDILQVGLLNHLRQQQCTHVIILCGQNDNPIEVSSLRDYLQSNGFQISLISHYENEPNAAGFDSIAAMFYIFNRHMLSDEELITVPLRDQGDILTPLKGYNSLLTSSEIPKPSYYAYLILSAMNGELLSCGKNYTVIKLHEHRLSYMVLTYNYNETIEKLCQTKSTLYEVKNAIDDFKDELEIKTNIELPKGKYFVVKYTFDDYNNIFNFMAKMNFPADLPISYDIPMSYCTTPQTDVLSTEIENNLEINSFFIGVGVQVVLVQKL